MLATHPYDEVYTFSGDRARALDAARTALFGSGFELVRQDEGKLSMRGEGMQSTKQNALCGATEVDIEVGGSTIHLKAALGGVAFMKRFVLLFPPGLILFLFGVFWLSGLTGSGSTNFTLLLCGAPWLVLGPLMARMIERRTRRALDSLLRSMAAAAR